MKSMTPYQKDTGKRLSQAVELLEEILHTIDKPFHTDPSATIHTLPRRIREFIADNKAIAHVESQGRVIMELRSYAREAKEQDPDLFEHNLKQPGSYFNYELGTDIDGHTFVQLLATAITLVSIDMEQGLEKSEEPKHE